MPHAPNRPTTTHKLCAMALTAFCFMIAATTASVSAGEDATFRWNEATPGELLLSYGEQPVLQYQYAFDTSNDETTHNTYKVYHHLFGPGTGTLLTKGPGGLYTHHRGLYIGWNKTETDGKSYDFWHCANGAHLRHEKIIEQEGNENHGSMTTEIHWNDADGNAVIIEERKVTITPHTIDGAPAWQVDWQTTLHGQKPEIKLHGDRQHAGFQYRAAQSVADSNGARYIRPEGFPEQPEAFEVDDSGDPPRHINLGWTAMTSEIEGKRYTVEYFEDPTSPKPRLFSERPYGRFGAYFPTMLMQDEPLTLHYRLIVTTGDTPKREEIQDRYDEFVAEVKK
ncbi:MAG: PmoA family protein [Planctomycetota bacterium]|nr:PmoA family protein [Planctomycetota bacterium]